MKIYKYLHIYSYKAPTKKALPSFLQVNHNKTGNNFIIFITVLTISFLLSYKVSECLIL